MFEPVKLAIGDVMGTYFSRLRPTTKKMPEFCSRPLEKAIAWCPARMIDQAEDMLAAWRKNATDLEDDVTASQGFGRLPAIAVAMDKSFASIDDIYTAEKEWVQLPNDPKERWFQVESTSGEIRVQVAFFAEDEPTARSLAAQFMMFMKRRELLDARVTFCFAGLPQYWPLNISTSSLSASNVATEANNLTILVVDFSIKPVIPFYDAPKAGEYHDDKGVPGTDDPAGYPVVRYFKREPFEPSIGEYVSVHGSMDYQEGIDP